MENDVKALYKEERIKVKEMEERRRLMEEENRLLATRLELIENSRVYKLSAPARKLKSSLDKNIKRIKRYGSLRGFYGKLKNKAVELKVKKRLGTAGFPDDKERAEEEAYVFDRDITVSILTPLYNTPEKYLREMMDSVKAQTYKKWQLCLADGSDAAHSYVGDICREYAAADPRIVYKKLEENLGISGNTNVCVKMATGEYIGLFDHDDILHPSVLFEYMKRICDDDADYLYCDEATFKGEKDIDHMIVLHFKPDFAIDNLRANNYICHFSVFKRELLGGDELFRTEFDGSQDHDMILRLTSRAKKIVHVPRILYYWRSHPASVAANINAKTYAIDAAKGAVADHLKKAGFENFRITSTRAFETIFRLSYEIKETPLVSIIIPNKEHKEDLKRCVDSIREKTTYENYEIVIVENNSRGREIRDYYEELKKDKRIRVTECHGPFNFSKICNAGVKKAKGEYILLLNNDTEVISINWIEELLMYAQREDVGAVGAKLYYPDDTIQHAGIVLGLGAHRTAGHTHYRDGRDILGYMGRLCYAQDVSAVTGACLLVRRALYDEVGGLDEEFAVSLNDVDFCLKLRQLGYLNVFTPFAELYHYESVSRGADDKGANAERYEAESARFKEKWKEVLDKGDPYYNPNFSLDHSDFRLRTDI